MQWLVDLVIAAIGIPPTFIDRGDPAATDFNVVTLTQDNAWHELDLSAIVPAGATGVALYVCLLEPLIAKLIMFRKHGNVNVANISEMNMAVVGTCMTADMIVPLDTDRKIDYWITAGAWIVTDITVKGWWL